MADLAKEYGKSLKLLAELLRRVRRTEDFQAVYRAAGMCGTANAGTWGYKIEDLIFYVDTPRHSIPAHLKKLRVELDVSLAGARQKGGESLRELAVNIVLFGEGRDKTECIAAWHLDRHIEGGNDGEPEEIHPLYHFQYGGRRVAPYAELFGAGLLTQSPRLAHPPLDGVLAIDFVLSHFAYRDWKTLMGDATYRNIVRKSQEVFWYPYFKSLVMLWDGSSIERRESGGLRLWPGVVCE